MIALGLASVVHSTVTYMCKLFELNRLSECAGCLTPVWQKYFPPVCPLELLSAGWGCTSSAELEEEGSIVWLQKTLSYHGISYNIKQDICMKSDSNSHSTMRVIRLLTEGGILLLAMQRYAPICSRDMSCKRSLWYSYGWCKISCIPFVASSGYVVKLSLSIFFNS